MCQMLFGDVDYGSGNYGEELKTKVEMLEAASYPCLDQYNNGGETELKLLSKKDVRNLPKSIDVINFTGNSTHRQYTLLK